MEEYSFQNYFNLCFKDKNNSYFTNMMYIIQNRGVKRDNNVSYLEKHHIIPKIWFKQNNIDISSVTEYNSYNIVYLSCKDRLRVNVLLYYLFRLQGNEYVFQHILSQIRFMTKIGYIQLVKRGDISKEVYQEYENEKINKYKNGLYNHRKYTKKFMKQCFDLFSSFENSQEGYINVCRQMNLTDIGNKDHLIQRFKKYIPLEDLEVVLKRQQRKLDI